MRDRPDLNKLDLRLTGLMAAEQALYGVEQRLEDRGLSDDDQAACLVELSKIGAHMETIGAKLSAGPVGGGVPVWDDASWREAS